MASSARLEDCFPSLATALGWGLFSTVSEGEQQVENCFVVY